MWILSFMLALACVADTTDDRRGDVYEAVTAYVEPLGLRWDSTAVRLAWTDLNGDAREDALVYLTGPDWCGTGGCTVLVFEAMDEIDAAEFGRFRPAAEISMVHGPILVSPSRGYWSDLIIESGRGGLHVLRFDGETYPMSPADGTRLDGPKPLGTTLFADAQ